MLFGCISGDLCDPRGKTYQHFRIPRCPACCLPQKESRVGLCLRCCPTGKNDLPMIHVSKSGLHVMFFFVLNVDHVSLQGVGVGHGVGAVVVDVLFGHAGNGSRCLPTSSATLQPSQHVHVLSTAAGSATVCVHTVCSRYFCVGHCMSLQLLYIWLSPSGMF